MPEPTALITGGTSGIGRATAELLHQRGYQVAVTGANPETIAAAQRELPDDILVVAADARSLTDTDALVEAVGSRFQTLDVLFLNAGINRPAPVDSFDEATFDELVDVNFKGQFFTLQKLLALLTDGSSVIFTVGIGVSTGAVGGSLTAATRGALLALVPSLALELAPRRIRVNAVSPGAVETPMWDKLGVPAEMRDGMSAEIPLGRFGTGAEIAEAVAFLASAGAAYITGQNIVVAGGGELGM